MHCVIIMFKHEFIKFFSALTPSDRNSLRCWLLQDQDGTNDVVECFNERVGFNPWSDVIFGSHIHSYLNDDPADHDNLHLAYGRLENFAKEDFLCREAQIASVEEDISGVLSQLRTSSGDLRSLFGRLYTLKAEREFPDLELQVLEDAVTSLGRIPTLQPDFPRRIPSPPRAIKLTDLTERNMIMTTSTQKDSKTPDVIKFDHRPFSENGPRGATVKAEFRCHGQTFSFAIQSEDAWLTKLTGQLDDIKRVSVCPKGKNNVSLYFAGGDFYINVPDPKQQSEIVCWWQQVLEDLC